MKIDLVRAGIIGEYKLSSLKEDFYDKGKESKSRQRLTMKNAIDTMRMYIFSYIRYTLL
ncbi:hypothetical protein bcere0022_29170 [Bacillus cereus Rock3-44]|nr:hypothetical protein bcere0022_29170 [Bacillus cereus Rock3-44]